MVSLHLKRHYNIIFVLAKIMPIVSGAPEIVSKRISNMLVFMTKFSLKNATVVEVESVSEFVFEKKV